MKTDEMFLLILALGLIIQINLADKIEAFDKTVSELPTNILSFITSPIFISSIIIFSLIGLVFLIIRHRNLRLEKEKLKVKELEKRKMEEEIIKKLLGENVSGLNSYELEKLIQRLERHNHYSKICSKIEYAIEELQRVKIKEYKKTEEYQKEKLLEEIEALRKQRYLEKLKLKDHRDVILEKLDIEENLIYEKEELGAEEIKILKEENFKETNEYDPILNENIKCFVKQILNHSASHTFLVGRIKKLLEQYLESDMIRLHNTKDADITFQVNYKIYAFEIETGTILSKKKQLKKKVSFLNNKYGQNWYFVVSNRDLAKKYRKCGRVTTRAGVRKIIEKLTNF